MMKELLHDQTPRLIIQESLIPHLRINPHIKRRLNYTWQVGLYNNVNEHTKSERPLTYLIITCNVIY